MIKPILGIQLYTLRDFCQNAEDFNETLSFVRSIGAETVQISAIGPISAEKQKELLENNGISVCVTHTPINRILQETDKVIEEHKIIGCDAIGLGSVGDEYRGSIENADKFIKELSPVLKKLKENNMTFNYHNHDFEFRPLENGQFFIDYLLENTDEEVFYFIPDVAWIDLAGQNPVEYLKKMKNRVKVCHFKDYNMPDGKREFCTLGEGKVDLKACYALCKELKVPYIVYEQDCDWINGDAKLSTELSWKYMNEIAG